MVIRRDMFKMKYQFSGSFEKSVVPVSLIVPVAMVLNGPNILKQSSSSAISILIISQLLIYNSLVRHHKDLKNTIRYCKEKEKPLLKYGNPH